MALQILPPDLKVTQDKIETQEPQPYWKPSSLQDGESEEFRLLGCYETGHAICGWQYASEIQDPKEESCVSTVMSLHELIQKMLKT